MKQLANYKVSNLDCGYLQSYFFLYDGYLIKRGYFMDSLTSVRVLNFYTKLPYIFKFLQVFIFLNNFTEIQYFW